MNDKDLRRVVKAEKELFKKLCKKTHADRIRAKSDEELAEFFGTLPCCPPGADLEELCFPLNSCEGTDLMVKCWLKWLKQEAEEGE